MYSSQKTRERERVKDRRGIETAVNERDNSSGVCGGLEEQHFHARARLFS